jgi:hypothetical protein
VRPVKQEDIFRVIDDLREQVARLELNLIQVRKFGPYKASFNVPASSSQTVDVDVDPEAIAGSVDQWVASGDKSNAARTATGNTEWITWAIHKIDADTVRITFKNHLTTNNPIGVLRFTIERFD